MKVWNNQLGKKTKWKEGHSWTEILDNVKEGDKVINGIGEVFICNWTFDTIASLKEDNIEHSLGDKFLTVWLHPTKKDGTLHKGRSSISYQNKGTGWEREYFY